eukprot:UN27126
MAVSATLTSIFHDNPKDLDTTTMVDIITLFNVLCSILMALFLTKVIARWWNIRYNDLLLHEAKSVVGWKISDRDELVRGLIHKNSPGKIIMCWQRNF